MSAGRVLCRAGDPACPPGAGCQAAVSAGDAASIQAASRHLTTGSTYLGKATARIQAIAAG